MAAAAEQLAYQFETTPPYLAVDDSFFLAGIRNAARRDALDIIEQRREHLRQADYEAVPLPVDAVGSARAVIEARLLFGYDSELANEKLLGLKLDCQRLLAEAARKNTYEYFPPLRQDFDTDKQEYVSHGFSILDMTKAGLTPIAEPEELERRINERVEEVTYLAIGRLALGERMVVSPEEQVKATKVRRIRTISECPDWAIEAYRKDSKGGYGGYVPEIEKRMIRDVVFDPITGARYEEQVGLSGMKIKRADIIDALAKQGIELASDISKTELHGIQFEVTDSLFSFVEALDKTAGVRTGENIFMGETVAQACDYSAIPAAAEGRQAALESHASQLAETLLVFAANGTDRWLATNLVGAKVKEILFSVARQDVSQAALMFNQATAQGLKEVYSLQQTGDLAGAQNRLNQVKASAPAPSYCGAGSCGLENLSVTGDQASKMKEMGLESKGSLKDTARRCPRCSKKDIVYDMKNKKKACTGCKSTTDFGKSSK
jgi:hypothetical protein